MTPDQIHDLWSGVIFAVFVLAIVFLLIWGTTRR